MKGLHITLRYRKLNEKLNLHYKVPNYTTLYDKDCQEQSPDMVPWEIS